LKQFNINPVRLDQKLIARFCTVKVWQIEPNVYAMENC